MRLRTQYTQAPSLDRWGQPSGERLWGLVRPKSKVK